LEKVKYEPKKIEKKWQKYWEEKNIFKTKIEKGKQKFYYLDMFPYPSGEMHMGHVRNYTIGDVISRYKTMQGYNVLHPMGWDAFGLPAENAAIEHKIHPAVYTKRNIEKMKMQIKSLGISYDWDREINTSSPEYYKWTQWIFVKMYKMGLAYKKMMPINWCPKCLTGLANEEVVNGCCERCGTEVTKKDLEQWMLKITAYAERLLNDLDKLDWPEKVKIMQKNWIGKSEGSEVIFKIISSQTNEVFDLPVFTTRADTLFGATYIVLAPEHPLVKKVAAKEKLKEIENYIEEVKKKSEIERTSLVKEKTGVFIGTYGINPVNNEKIPVFIADYVLLTYGTGAIMAVPAHDERDFEFAKKFSLPIVEVISSPDSKKDKNGQLLEAYTGEGILINSQNFNGITSQEARIKITEWLAEKNLAKFAINYKLRDWIFSRQRYWGEPIPIVYCENCGEVVVPEEELPVLLPPVKEYQPTGTGKSPLANILEFVNTTCPECKGNAKRETDTMPQWAGSSWYFLRFADPHNTKEIFAKDMVNFWLPVDQYVGGIEHAILHLLYARFFTKVLYDLKIIDFDEPFKRLFNQGMITKDGAKMSKSKGNVVSPDEIIEKYGADTLRLFILFVGPPEFDAEWSDQGVEGCFRFITRLYREIQKNIEKIKIYKDLDKVDLSIENLLEDEKNIMRKTHQTIKKVTEDIENFHFHTAISKMMELVNSLSTFEIKEDKKRIALWKYSVEKLILLLSPFIPHFAEEIWEMLGGKESIYYQKWPGYDEFLCKEEKIILPVQINGKLRDKLEILEDSKEEEIKKLVFEREKVKKYLEGKKIKKFIYVKKRLVNIVIE
jgi:leucyl-tRNA synthetase